MIEYIEKLPKVTLPFKTKFVLVTPEIAKELLKYNSHNRKIRSHDLRRYKFSLTKNEWCDGTSILWFSSDALIDGQHRLQAVVDTGVSAMFQINYLASEDVQKVIDIGRGRTASDTFLLENIPNSTIVQSEILCYFGEKIGDISGTLKEQVSTSNQIAEYYSDESFWQDTARFAARLTTKPKGVKKSLIATSVVGGLTAYLIKERNHNRTMVWSFFTQILSDDTCENATLNKFRKWLSSTESKPTKAELFNLIATYWNAYLLNKAEKEPRKIAFDKHNRTKFL